MPQDTVKFDINISIPHLPGKVIVITGGNNGIGKATCLTLAKNHASSIFILARNAQTSQDTINELKAISPDINATFVSCDLSSLSSVQSAARNVLSQTQRIDILFCNAGINGVPPALTQDGYEIVFGTNHLGHALLNKLLLPTLLRTVEEGGDVRVVSISSEAHRFHPSAGIAFKSLKTTQENLGMFKLVGGWLRYAQSKLANLVYMAEMAEREPRIKWVSVHPGVVDTGMAPSWFKTPGLPSLLNLKTTDEGSWNQLWAATSEDVVNGEYYTPVGITGSRTKKAKDPALRHELGQWTDEQLKDWTV